MTQPDVPAPAYTGESVVLRAVTRQDFATFLGWRSQLTDMRVWTAPTSVPSLEQFTPEMDLIIRQSLLLLVTTKEDGQAIGFVQAYNMNQVDGWCFLAVYFAPEFRRQRYGAEAFLPFVDYLFRHFNLHKIYMEMQEFNMAFYQAAIETGAFVEEGRFRDHTRYDGRYWDMVRVALYRDAWNNIRDWANLVVHDERDGMELVADRQASVNGEHGVPGARPNGT